VNERMRAGKVGRLVDIESVALRSVEARLPPPHPDGGPVEIEATWESSHSRPTPDHVAFAHRVALVAAAPHEFQVDAEFELLYRLPVDADVDNEDLAAFAEVSVSFSAFPYVRELVHGLTARAALPPLVLPPLRSPLDPPPEGT